MRPTSRGLAALLTCSACILPACTTRNPVTGRPEVILMSEEQEQAIDEQQASQIEAQIGLVRDEEIAEYVDAIGQTLASHSPRKEVTYHFDVVEMDEPNAFALPGGHIYISRGLLLLANSEAELAAVIGHEIGHVAARHAAQRHAHMKTMGIATLLGTLASGSSAGAGRSGKIGPGGSAAYSRDQEREADGIGQDIVVEAGIDPTGMASFLRSLENSTRLTVGFSVPTGYFSTHPATPERIAEAQTTAQLRRWSPGFSIAPTQEEYLTIIEGMAVGRPASEGVIEGSNFYHADLNFSVRFPHGWTIINQSAQVVAISPRQEAMLLLELQEPGNDPRLAAEHFAQKEEVRFSSSGALRIGKLDAFRARGVAPVFGGPTDAEITWVAHEGKIYRLTAGTRVGSFRRFAGIFRSFPKTFRPLREEDRAEISDLRLRLAPAMEGETLAELSDRVGNDWNLNRLAVFNRLSIATRLEEGQLVKVAIREVYTPEPAATEAPAEATPGDPPPDDEDQVAEQELGPGPMHRPGAN